MALILFYFIFWVVIEGKVSFFEEHLRLRKFRCID